ncbi:transposable element Tcb2 transposase [Trichonephila clavipes]|nr:transposable element Tcb2 transposase [Trichonephila clavipes]
MACLPLTARHRVARRKWASQHCDITQMRRNTNTHDSHLSPEFEVATGTRVQSVTVSKTLMRKSNFQEDIIDSRCTFTWREPVTPNLFLNVREIYHYSSDCLVFWESITLDGCTRMHVFERCTVMNENARLRRAHLVDEFQESQDIRCINIAVRSPHLILIPHAWDSWGHSHSPSRRTLTEGLKPELLNEWN